MNPPIAIRLQRDLNEKPWGFRLQGGSDNPVPLSIQWVNPNTLAEQNGLEAGDQVISINNRDVAKLTHEEAKMEITRSGNELELTVIKGAINQLKHTAQKSHASTGNNLNQTGIPLNTEASNERTSYETAKGTYWPPPDYTQETPEYLRPKVINFESTPAFNRDPLQREVWRPKAYRDDPQAPSRQVGTAVYHAQYNSPIGLYSDDKVLEAFKSQTAGLIDEFKGNPQTEPPAQSSADPDPLPTVPLTSEGKISRSFRILEHDVNAVEGTNKLPKSIFDQRRQQKR